MAAAGEVVAVPGLIPEEAFFKLLAERRFPVTGWLRRPEEFDYVVEPDVFRDASGNGLDISRPGRGRAAGVDPRKAALADLCHVLLNANEFLYVD